MGHLFHKAAGLDIVYVPFKGTPETVNGLLTGSVELIYAANQIVAPLIASGQLRALAKLDRDAPPSMADIPTLADARAWAISTTFRSGSGWWRPEHAEADHRQDSCRGGEGFDRSAVKEKSERTGNYPMTSTPEQFSAFIRKEAARWSKVIQETGIKLD